MTPSEPIKISFSSSDAYRQCALKHHLMYVERWRTKETPAALSRGTALHSLLEFHYRELAEITTSKQRQQSDAAILDPIRAAAVKKGLISTDDEEAELIAWMYDGYVDYYKVDSAWEILAVELDFEIPLYDRTGKKSRFVMIGKIDLIVRNRGTGKVFVVDHKTCSTLPTEKALDFDEQMAFYTIAARRLGHKVHGAIYSAIRSKKLKRDMTPADRFLRRPVTKTDFELKTVEHELVDTMEDAYRDRGGVDPPRSPDSDRCNWKCGLREACLAGRKSGPERMRAFMQDTGWKTPAMREDSTVKPVVETAIGGQLDLVAELEKLTIGGSVKSLSEDVFG